MDDAMRRNATFNTHCHIVADNFGVEEKLWDARESRRPAVSYFPHMELSHVKVLI